MGPVWRIEMLGGLRVRRTATLVDKFRTKNTGALLALLALRRGHPIPRDEASDLIWQDETQDSARNSLRIALSALRRVLEPDGVPAGTVICSDRSVVALRAESFANDVEEFEMLAKRNSPLIEDLNKAIGLYEGELLPGLHQDWICTERARLADLYVVTLQKLAQLHEVEGHFERAIDMVHQAIRADPFAEESYRIGMRAHIGLGRVAAAQDLFTGLEALLAKELDMEPAEETKNLALSLRLSPGRVPLSLSARENVETPQRFPIPSTAFFGRERELKDLQALVTGEAPGRWITVVGPGGIGKTRVALEVASLATSSFKGRVWFIGLADTTSEHEVLSSVCNALGGEWSGEEAYDRIAARLKGDRVLVILDNIEQILPHAAAFSKKLMDRTPNAMILATSRRPAGTEDCIYPLQPLEVPEREVSAADILNVPSVQLFVDRAQRVRPDFALTPRLLSEIAGLSSLLEGVPLAVELAAGRSRILSVRDMLEHTERRLELLEGSASDAMARHRSLKAALDWSYALLAPEEQSLLGQLSVFRGGWTLESAKAVCSSNNLLGALADLEASSLITVSEELGQTRFRMLEMVREFATGRLSIQEAANLATAHSNYFLSMAIEAGQHFESADQGEWVDRVEAEMPNLKAALGSLSEPRSKHRLLGAIWPYWLRRGLLSEGRELVETAISDPSFDKCSGGGLRLLEAAARLADVRCDFKGARAHAECGLAASRTTGDRNYEVEFLTQLGVLAKREARNTEAYQLWTEALAIAREERLERAIGRLLLNLATLARIREAFNEARELYDEALPIFRGLGDPHMSGIVLQNLGLLSCDEGDYEASSRYLHEALTLRGQIGNLAGMAFTLGALGQTALAAKQEDKAWGYYSECLDLCLRLGNRTGLEHCLWDLTHAFRARGMNEFAARALGAIRTIHGEIGIGLQPYEKSIWDEAIESLKANMGEAVLARVMAEGGSLDIDQAAKELRKQLASIKD